VSRFDKIVQYIVFANGRAGMNGEHTPVDAPAPGVLCDYVLSRLRGRGPTDPDPADSTAAPATAAAVRPLRFTVPGPVQAAIKTAAAEFQSLADELEVCVLRECRVSGKWCREVGKVSPDSLVQMAMQLAFFVMQGEGSPTYETAQVCCGCDFCVCVLTWKQTRQFYHGRTETVRVFSAETVAFCQGTLLSLCV
jgi:carnitine O-acetyltransferase